MYNFDFQNQGTNAYLVYKVGDDILDNISFNMITNNKIKGLAPLVFTQINNDRYLRYNITSKRPLNSFLEQTVNRKSLLTIFLNITNSFVYADEYMIESTLFVLDPEFIFVDITNCETSVICLPLTNKATNTKLSDFFRTLINSAKPLSTENMGYIGEIIGYLNGSESFSIHNFIVLLNRLLNDMPAVSANRPTVSAVATTPAPQVAVSANAAPVQRSFTSQPPLQQFGMPSNGVTGGVPNNGVPGGMPNNGIPGGMPNNGMPGGGVPNGMPNNNIPGGRPGGVPGGIPNNNNVPNGMPNNIPGGRPGGGVPNKNIPAPGGNKMPPVQSNNFQSSADTQEEKITWSYLMQHYNAENKAKYDAQKARKKAGKGGKAPAPAKNMPNRNMPGAQNAPMQPFPNNPMQRPMNNPMQQPMNNPMQQPMNNPMQRPMNSPMQQPMSNPIQPPVNSPQHSPAPNNGNFGGTVDLRTFNQQNAVGTNGAAMPIGGYSEGTTVLNQNFISTSSASLLRSKNRENIQLTGTRFRIGKERSQVEYFIGDNTNISRNHVDIINENREYYIIDIGSTNGTFLNGARITPHTKMRLTDGDRIRLANEEFEFMQK